MTTSEQSASAQITEAVTAWPGVVPGPGNRGEFSFKVGSREIRHLHGDDVAHFSFPKEVWRSLCDERRIDYHPVFPRRAGMGARRMGGDSDFDGVIALMRLNYERIVSRPGVPTAAAA